MMHPKLMLKIFFPLFLFGLKTLNAAPLPTAEITEEFTDEQAPSLPQIMETFSINCLNLKKEMEKIENSDANIVNEKKPVLKKMEFRDYIFTKIDFLVKMVQKFAPFVPNNERNTQKNYFFTDNFVRLMQKFANYIYEVKFQGGGRVTIDLFGRSYIGKLLDLLEGLSKIKLIDHIKNVKFEEMKGTMIDFIKKLKIEIIFGQTHKQFIEMGKKLIEEKSNILKKIANAEETSFYQAQKFKKDKGYSRSEFKKLYLKYKRLNDLSLELYNELIRKKIPEMIEKREKKNGITIQWEEKITKLGKKFKNAFDQIVSVSKTMLNANKLDLLKPLEDQVGIGGETRVFNRENGPDREAIVQIEANSKNKPADYVAPKEAATRNFDDPTWLDYIEHNLSLPDFWVNKERDLLEPKRDIEQSVTRATVRLNAGVLLMALERMKKCF